MLYLHVSERSETNDCGLFETSVYLFVCVRIVQVYLHIVQTCCIWLLSWTLPSRHSTRRAQLWQTLSDNYAEGSLDINSHMLSTRAAAK